MGIGHQNRDNRYVGASGSGAELMLRADRCLDTAKESGRNRVVEMA